MKPKAGETTKAPLSEALLDAMAAIQKTHGDGSIMRMGDRVETPIEGISTGSLGLDLCIGGKGLPRGRVIEVFGPESSGKTTLTLHVVANAQRQGGVCAFIDAEHALDPQYAKRLGVDLDSLLISQPDNGEQALDICETLAKSGAIDVIVIDSVAALVPKAEIEGEMGDSFMGLQARLMSQALRKLTHTISQSKTALVFINQIRHKIGVMFGNPETTPGGLALKFYTSLRMDIRRIENIKQGDVVVGMKTRVKVVKNKMAPPYRAAEFEVIHGFGVSREGCLLDMGVEAGIVEKTGSWLLYKTERLGQGRENAKDFLKNSPQIAQEIENALKAKYLTSQQPAETVSTKSEKTDKVEAPAKGKEKEKASAR